MNAKTFERRLQRKGSDPRELAQAKPGLTDRVVPALLSVSDGRYRTPECRNIAIGKAIERFVRDQRRNSRKSTRDRAERFLRRTSTLALSFVLALALQPAFSLHAEVFTESFCPVALHEETIELQDAELSVDLARSAVAAFDEIYHLIDGLWKNDAIDRMGYLRAKHDRDAAKLDLERADLILARQEALIEQFRLICESGSGTSVEDRAREIRDVYLRYHRAECDQRAKAIEVAETNLTFNRQWLESVVELREQVSTRQDVILAELDVAREEKRRADATRRTEACRAELKRLEGDSAPAD